MKPRWEKWLYYNADMFMRHIGTAGAVWIGTGVKAGHLDWANLWAYLLSGAIVPTIFTIFSRGLPKDEDEARGTQETKE